MSASEHLDARFALRLGALDLDVELSVPAGETVAVVGPNGAGKTTLLRALAGLLPVDQGRVALAGVTLDEPATGSFVVIDDRSIGMMFQDYLLFPHLSVLDNVAFGLRSRRVARRDAQAQARHWLARVDLSELERARPRQLSGGQAQRVALARALAVEPALLLLDEPLAALDATTRVETRRALRRHLSDHDGVRIVVTHDPLDAAALADRIVVLDGGRIVQQGTLAELTAQPRTRYVADFVGTNLLAGRATGAHVDVGGLTVTIADRAEGEVLVTIPPRAVVLSTSRPVGTARNVWRGVVDGIDRSGDRARVRVRGPVTIVAEVTGAATDDLHLVDGTDVWVAVKATEIDVSAA